MCVFLLDSEMYGDLCKPEDDAKFDSLLSDELIADITSCMSDDLPISLEQFYEINHLVDATAEIDSSDYHYLLLNPDVIVSDVVSMESYGSDPDDVSKISDETDTLQYSVSEADIGTSPGSPDSEVASIECEELYEESVAVVEVLPSTISCEEFEDLMTGNGGTSVIESVSVVEVVPSTISCEEFEDLMTSGCDTDRDLSDDVETARPSHRHPRAELTNSRRLRKKEQNKTAALRYRLKKRSEQGLVMTEYVKLERKNIELRTRLDAMTKEISYLKSLIDELCP